MRRRWWLVVFRPLRHCLSRDEKLDVGIKGVELDLCRHSLGLLFPSPCRHCPSFFDTYTYSQYSACRCWLLVRALVLNWISRSYARLRVKNGFRCAFFLEVICSTFCFIFLCLLKLKLYSSLKYIVQLTTLLYFALIQIICYMFVYICEHSTSPRPQKWRPDFAKNHRPRRRMLLLWNWAQVGTLFPRDRAKRSIKRVQQRWLSVDFGSQVFAGESGQRCTWYRVCFYFAPAEWVIELGIR